MINNLNLYSTILGFAIGDALGYPVQFQKRDYLKTNPVSDFIESRQFRGMVGVWTDDTSLTLCLLESLKNGLDYEDIGNKFVSWLYAGYMTPFGMSIDVGITTAKAINNIKLKKFPITKCGLTSIESNGNGSLMRILPLAFYTKDMSFNERISVVKNVSSLTHGHWISVVSCIILIEFALELLKGLDISLAYRESVLRCRENQNEIIDLYENSSISISDYNQTFNRILSLELKELSEPQIKSSGYVVDTLESAIWSLLSSNSLENAILTAVNLGNDCDTIGAITGGIAGLYYGFESIPNKWIDKLQGKEIIQSVCKEFL